MLQSEATALRENEADEERTKRLFVGLFASALGVDQNYVGDDGRALSPTGQYIIANPDGTYSELGRSVSNVQQAAAPAASGLTLSPGLLLVLGVALLLLK